MTASTISGNIVPTEILFGTAQRGMKLRYIHAIPCSISSWILNRPLRCDYRFVWNQWLSEQERSTQPGVWILRRAPEASWAEFRWDTGFRPLDYHDYSVGILSKRTH